MHIYLKTKYELNSKSYILLVFPIYYLPDLTKDAIIECTYIGSSGDEIDI